MQQYMSTRLWENKEPDANTGPCQYLRHEIWIILELRRALHALDSEQTAREHMKRTYLISGFGELQIQQVLSKLGGRVVAWLKKVSRWEGEYNTERPSL